MSLTCTSIGMGNNHIVLCDGAGAGLGCRSADPPWENGRLGMQEWGPSMGKWPSGDAGVGTLHGKTAVWGCASVFPVPALL